MAVIEFGSGVMYSLPNAGNLAANPTPTRLLLQEVSVEFKGDLKKLYTQSQFPIATARGKINVSGKAKIVNYDPDPINQLFWGQSIAVGIQIPVDLEADTPTTGATGSPNVTVTSGGVNFTQDNGVTYAGGTKAGAMLLKVSGTPALGGTYSVNATGNYLFSSADNNTAMYISYTFTNATRGKTITLANQLMGFAPVCQVQVWGTFRAKILGIQLNSCTFGSWTYPTKLEDFWMSDVAFEANVDASNNLGLIFADTF
jgi:hypothetical protein